MLFAVYQLLILQVVLLVALRAGLTCTQSDTTTNAAMYFIHPKLEDGHLPDLRAI
jgi:hypothetical protein